MSFFLYCVKGSNFILLHIAVQFPQNHLVKNLFPLLYILAFFAKDKVLIGACVYFRALFCWVSLYFYFCASTILFWWLLFCSSLKAGKLIPVAPFFSLKIALAIWGLLCFHTNHENFCSSSVKNTIGSLIGIALNW